MSDVSFELWSNSEEFPELLPFLESEGVVVGKRLSLMRRSEDAAHVTTIIVALSGASIAVARAFRAYFERTGKTFTASTEDGQIHAENFTAEEVRMLIKSSRLLLLSKPKPKDKQ